MLDEVEVEVLVSALRDLVRVSPLLDDLVEPSTPASGSSAGVTASAPGPREPVRGHAFDVQWRAWDTLRAWAPAVTESGERRGPVGDRCRVGVWAAWLLSHVDLVVVREDAGKAVAEIGPVAREVLDLVEPPMTEREQRRLADEQEHDADLAWGSERQVVEGAAVLGRQVSKSSVRRWADAGAVRSAMMPDGSRRLLFEDVLAMCDGKEQRVAETRRVDGDASA